MELEQVARRSRDSNDKNYEIWIVIDVDEHHHLKAALDTARQNGIGNAVSNPCFELWAIYHFEQWHAPLSRKEARERLATHVSGYGKNGKRFTAYSCAREHKEQCEAVHNACKRSERAVSSRRDEGDEGGNPSSTCHELVKKLLQI